jgi:hypothetical protein
MPRIVIHIKISFFHYVLVMLAGMYIRSNDSYRTAAAAISLETEVIQKTIFCYLIPVLNFPLRV